MEQMAKLVFKCRDIGFECNYEANGKYVDEIVPKIIEHLRVVHNLDKLDDEMKDRIAKSINKVPIKIKMTISKKTL